MYLFLKVGYIGTAMRPGSALVLDKYGKMGWYGGTFAYFMEKHLEINCNMNFENYPMDEQICYFRMLSPMYKHEQLVSLLNMLKDTDTDPLF